MNKVPEIMAPVSNMDMLLAAIHAGADSVYIGMPDFNARGRADKLSLNLLQELIETARLYSVKTYIAFNILIFEDELEGALKSFLTVDELCPDAWIVQDIGLAALMKKIKPDTVLHASTQATVLNSSDIVFFNDLFQRYTLARELGFDEIRAIAESTRAELEVFIHGSLCISYSGQCFTSSGFGGRSANRGECAQSCRHEYDLYVDDRKIDTGGHYLVSPRDLMAPDYAQKLAGIGIAALKIEGRLKSPEYVASAVNLYRHLLDKDRRKYVTASQLTFSRNAGPGWLGGHNYSGLIQNSINGHTGLLLGKVAGVSDRTFTIHIGPGHKEIGIQRGDGLLVRSGDFETGGFIYDVTQKKIAAKEQVGYEISMSREFPLKKIRSGMDIFLSSSSAIEKETRKIYTDKSQLKRIRVNCKLSGRPGESLVLKITDGEREVTAISPEAIQKAQKQPPSMDLIRKEVSALSSTPFVADEIELDISDDSFVPNAVLKELRQKAVTDLIILRRQPRAIEKATNPSADTIKIITATDAAAGNTGDSRTLPLIIPKIHLLARNPDQLDIVLSLDEPGIDTIYLDYTYGRPYAESVKKIKLAGRKAGVATMRVYKPGEEKQVTALAKLNPDAILIRNTTAFQMLKEAGDHPAELVGDFSLNITNHTAAGFYLSRGLSRLTGSYDLVFDEGRRQNPARLLSFMDSLPAGRAEICLRYYLPSFYMDYCLFSAYLAGGRDFRSCGLPCTRHNLKLKDRKGEFHPVIADNNCRNEMFNGQEKDISDSAPRFTQKGVADFRIELGPYENNREEISQLLSRIARKAAARQDRGKPST